MDFRTREELKEARRQVYIAVVENPHGRQSHRRSVWELKHGEPGHQGVLGPATTCHRLPE